MILEASETKASVSSLNDQQLMADAQAGSLRAFDEIARRFQVPLMRYLMRKVGQTSDAEDIFQETMLAAYRHLKRYNSRWSCSTWLFAIARNQAASYTRRNKRVFQPSDQADDAVSRPVDAVKRLDQAEQSASLWTVARQQLSADQFDVLWMTFALQWPIDKVAQSMGNNGLAVRVALHRAKKNLKSAALKAGMRVEDE